MFFSSKRKFLEARFCEGYLQKFPIAKASLEGGQAIDYGSIIGYKKHGDSILASSAAWCFIMGVLVITEHHYHHRQQ